MPPSDRALERFWPATKDVPRVRLGLFPTPVEPLDLSGAIPSFRGRAWVKREDRAGVDLGGNKVRKLELLFGQALDQGGRAFVTTGGVGSNHCLAATWYAPEADLEPHLVIFPHHVTPSSRRTLRAIASLGPRITFSRSATASPAVAAAVFAKQKLDRRHPLLIPPGGCTVTGTLGWVEAGLEIAESVGRGEIDEPDVAFVAYSSGGSAAGLAVGLQLGGLRTAVVAVRTYPLPASSTTWTRNIAERTHQRLEKLTGQRLRPIDLSRLTVAGEYLGPGYAVPTEAGSAATDVAADLGLVLDSTYTAKAFAAVLDAAASPRYRESSLLFVLTYDGRLPEGLLDGFRADLLPRPLRKYA